MRNANQILGILTAAFGTEAFQARSDSTTCVNPQTDVEELGCEWQSIVEAARLQQGGGGGLDGDWIARICQVCSLTPTDHLCIETR